MTDKPDILPTLDPPAFALALVLAPLVVALMFCWALLIPVLAVIFGGLPYLVFGGPLLLAMANRAPMRAGRFALLGLGAQCLFLAGLAALSAGWPQRNGLIAFYGAFGLPMAALWFAAFALLYRHFWRPILPILP